MKNRYQTMMKNITIAPEARAFIDSRIEAAPAPVSHTHAPRRKPLAAIAACLAVVVLLFLTPAIAEALRLNRAKEEFLDCNDFTEQEILYTSPEGYYEIFSFTDADGKEHTTTIHDYLSGSHRPFWLKQEGDRLYFVGGGEKIDITDRFDEQTPFMKVFTDGRVMYYVSVGGRFDPNDPWDSFMGFSTFLRNDPNSTDPIPGMEDGWISGDSFNNLDPKTDICWPWFATAVTEYNPPWIDHYTLPET